jgi:hypothetical protein
MASGGFTLNKEEGLLHIISHTDLDGVVAAAVAWHAHYYRGSPIRLSLTGYGEVDNLLLETLRRGAGMIALDLSPQHQNTVDEIDRVFVPGDPPFIFDHHKSTFEKYKNRPWLVVDMDRCGAGVYWDWLFAGNAGGEALSHIEPLREIVLIATDRDLWINENPDSRLWQAMVTLCGEWGALSRLMANPSAVLTGSERSAVVDFIYRQEERFKRAKEQLVRERVRGIGEVVFLGDGHLEFGDTSDFCGMILDKPGSSEEKAPAMVALAYRKAAGGWAVSLRSRGGLSGRVVSLLRDGRKIRGGGHGDAAALYFPGSYSESGVKESICAALSVENESSLGMGVTIGDLLKGAM